jgi:hypothetical protein
MEVITSCCKQVLEVVESIHSHAQVSLDRWGIGSVVVNIVIVATLSWMALLVSCHQCAEWLSCCWCTEWLLHHSCPQVIVSSVVSCRSDVH